MDRETNWKQGRRSRSASRAAMWLAPVGAAALLAGARVDAAPIYWDGTGTSWNLATNWSTDPAAATPDPAAAPGAADIATFNITGLNTAQTVSLDADQAAQGLSLVSTGAVTLQGGGVNHTLSLGASGITAGANTTKFNIGSATTGQNVNVSLQADQAWIYNGANASGDGIFVNNAVSLGIAGTHALTLGGSSGTTSISVIGGVISDGGIDRVLNIALSPSNNNNRWNFGGNNTYTGTTTISSGALGITSANALGSVLGGTDVASGGALFLRGTTVTYAAEPLTIRGIGPSGSARGALRNVTGVNTWTGPISAIATSGNVRVGADGGSLTFASTADITTIGTNSLDFEATGDIIVNSNISGTASLAKILGGGTGAGILTLAGNNNSYTGATTVNVGVLRVNGALTATAAATVAVGATLQGNGGSINPAATTTINGTLAPGATTTPAIGTLSMGPLTLTSTSTYATNINTSTLASDLVNVTGALSIDPANTAVLTVSDLGSDVPLPAGAEFKIIDYTGAWNGGLFQVNGSTIADDTGSFTVGSNTFNIDYNGGASGNDVILRTAVPEPGAAAGLFVASLGALLGGRRRRRRRALPLARQAT